jgi:hypothetical protein
MALFNQMLEAQRRFQLELFSKTGVVGVGLGYKDNKGERTDQLAVVALVEQKKPKAALRDEDMVPPELDGAKTDVIEVGVIRAQLNSGTRDEWRPKIPPGVSIGHYQVTAGTFGVLVYDRITGEPLILSNNHVLANSNDATIGDPILQPGPTDGGDNPSDLVARLLRFGKLTYIGEAGSGIANPIVGEMPTAPTTPTTPTAPLPTTPVSPTNPVTPTNPTIPPASNDGCAQLIVALGNSLARMNKSDTRLTTVQAASVAYDPYQASTIEAQAAIVENQFDAALARPVDSSVFSNELLKIGRITGTMAPKLGAPVRKIGRTTDYTEGSITVVNTIVDVGYNTLAGKRTARFSGQVMCTGMSQGGDSGSLIVDAASQNAVGLLFAGSGTATIFTPIELVLAKLNVQLNPK